MLEYLKSHVALLVILILIVIAILALVVLLIINLYRKNKAAPAQPEANAEPEPEPATETEATPDSETDRKEKEAQKTEEEPMKREETKPELKSGEPKKAVKAVPAEGKAPAKGNPGKWVIYEEERGGFGFRLLASNGELMLKSSAPYASLQSAKAGIKTYQDNIAADRLEIVETKKGNFFVQVNNASNRMLATSADYQTRTRCESALASIKRWAASAVIVTEEEDK